MCLAFLSRGCFSKPGQRWRMAGAEQQEEVQERRGTRESKGSRQEKQAGQGRVLRRARQRTAAAGCPTVGGSSVADGAGGKKGGGGTRVPVLQSQRATPPFPAALNRRELSFAHPKSVTGARCTERTCQSAPSILLRKGSQLVGNYIYRYKNPLFIFPFYFHVFINFSFLFLYIVFATAPSFAHRRRA